MNLDELFNDEIVGASVEVETPVFNGKIIVCKTMLVTKANQLMNRITHILDISLPCEVHVYNTVDENVFVITLGTIEQMVSEKSIKTIQTKLHDRFEIDLSTGFIEIQVYPDADIYKDGHVEAGDFVYEERVAKNKPLINNFVGALTQQYTPSINKSILNLPELIL